MGGERGRRSSESRGKCMAGGGRGRETYVECFCPLASSDLTFSFAHAEKDTASLTVGGADFLVVQRVGVIKQDHVPRKNGRVVDGCQAEAAAWGWLLLVLGICARFQGL